MFHDGLLIRTSSGYEPTPEGQQLLHELDSTLLRLDRLLSGTDFDPAVEEASFRRAAMDHASHVLCPLLCRTMLPRPSKVTFKFVPLHDAQFEAAEKGRIDLLLVADDGTAPAHLRQRGHLRG
jgi:DNA-binding transcriptional LysR family regulator